MKRLMIVLSVMALLLFSGSLALAAPDKPDRERGKPTPTVVVTDQMSTDEVDEDDDASTDEVDEDVTEDDEAATEEEEHGKPEGVGLKDPRENSGKSLRGLKHVSGVVMADFTIEPNDDASFGLKDPRLGDLTVLYGADTRWTSGKKKAHPAEDPATVKAGDRVLAFGSFNEDKTEFTAVRIHVIPGRPGYWHVAGEVTKYEGGIIEVANKHDAVFTFNVVGDGDGKTVFSPEDAKIEVGSWVTVVGDRPAEGDDWDTPNARAIVLHASGPKDDDAVVDDEGTDTDADATDDQTADDEDGANNGDGHDNKHNND